MIAYHVYFLIRKEKTTVVLQLNEYPLVSAQPAPANAEVTFSVVEIRQPQCSPSEPDSDESGNIQQSENYCNVTTQNQ